MGHASWWIFDVVDWKDNRPQYEPMCMTNRTLILNSGE